MSSIRRTVLLTLCGAVSMALAIVVLVLNRDLTSDLLAVLGLIGGIAIIIVSLPYNGNGKK